MQNKVGAPRPEKRKPCKYHGFLRGLIYVLPVVCFCAYYPLWSLGGNESTNFELSLPEIWLVIFLVATLPLLGTAARFYRAQGYVTRIVVVAMLGVLIFAGASLLWTLNLTRGVLTFGLLGLVFYAVLILYFLLCEFWDERQRWRLLYVFLGTAVGFALLGWVQCLLDVWGVDSSLTLLCDGCTYTAFGFPRLVGLAIEPQFMGNLLLAPTLLALYGVISGKTTRRQQRWLGLVAGFLVASIWLTLSRGAIYALVIGVVLMLICAFAWRYDRRWLVASKLRQRRAQATCETGEPCSNKPNKSPNRGVENVQNFRQLWLLVAIPVAGCGVGLLAQGGLAALSPTNDTFLAGVTKSIHQMSLGVVDLRGLVDTSDSVGKSTGESTSDADAEMMAETTEITSTFAGYVTESTDVRLDLSDLALDIWDDSGSNFLSGVGLGGAGVALSNKSDELSSQEIVQNQYISVLLELGVVGLALVVLLIVYLARLFSRGSTAVYFLPLLAASLVSLLFFAGLPNALHLYLFPALLFGTLPFLGKPVTLKQSCLKNSKQHPK